MKTTYSTENNICHTCFRYDHMPLIKGKIDLSLIPHLCLLKILEKMEYVSFTRTRLTNKMMYDYVDRNRGRLTVNIFHNYSIDFHLHPERPHFTFSPPKIKPTDVDLSIIFNNNEEQLDYCRFLLHHRAISDRINPPWKRPYSYWDGDKRNATKFLYNFGQELTFSYGRRHQRKEYKLDLSRWKADDFIRRELRGHWHPAYLHIDGYINKGRVWQDFAEFVSEHRLKGCFVKRGDIRRQHEFWDILEPSAISTKIFSSTQQLSFQWATNLQYLTLKEGSRITFDNLMLVVPKLEGLCLIGINDDDLSLHVFMEAIDLWKGGGVLKQMVINTPSSYPKPMMQDLERMGGEILNGKKKKQFFEEYPMFTSFLGEGVSIRLEEETGTRMGIVLIRRPTILFYSVPKKQDNSG